MKYLLTIISLVLFLVSCSRHTYAPIENNTNQITESNTTDSIAGVRQLHDSVRYITNYRDSLILRDSVIVVVDTIGNVVYREHFRDTYKSHDSNISHERSVNSLDSAAYLLRSTTLSDNKSATVNKIEVPAKLSVWQKAMIYLGSLVTCSLFAAAIFGISKIWRKLRGK